MNYQTELMQQILTNEKAQEIIDYVSQIYGESYVGLWIYQAIGSALEPVSDLTEQLMDETNPTTTSLLISYWEGQYGIQGDPTMTIEQRRATVIAAMRSKGACNPARLANAISAALGGAPVEIFENTGQNKFTVNIRASVKSFAPARAVIERMKPAHLIYSVQGVTQESASTDIYAGLAMTRAMLYAIRPENSLTELLVPVIVGLNALKIKRVDPITGAQDIEEAQHTYDGSGTVTLITIKGESDGAGAVTLKAATVREGAATVGQAIVGQTTI